MLRNSTLDEESKLTTREESLFQVQVENELDLNRKTKSHLNKEGILVLSVEL
jgi:hypothetical protein